MKNLDFAIIFFSLITKSTFDLKEFLKFLKQKNVEDNTLQEIELLFTKKEFLASKMKVFSQKFLDNNEEKLVKDFLKFNHNKFFIYYGNTLPKWANFLNNLEDSVVFSNQDLTNLDINKDYPALLYDKNNKIIFNPEENNNWIQQLLSFSYIKDCDKEINWQKIFYIPFEKPVGKYIEKEGKMRFNKEKVLIKKYFNKFNIDFINIWNQLIFISNRAYIWDLKYFIISDRLITKDKNGNFKFN